MPITDQVGCLISFSSQNVRAHTSAQVSLCSLVLTGNQPMATTGGDWGQQAIIRTLKCVNSPETKETFASLGLRADSGLSAQALLRGGFLFMRLFEPWTHVAALLNAPTEAYAGSGTRFHAISDPCNPQNTCSLHQAPTAMDNRIKCLLPAAWQHDSFLVHVSLWCFKCSCLVLIRVLLTIRVTLMNCLATRSPEFEFHVYF